MELVASSIYTFACHYNYMAIFTWKITRTYVDCGISIFWSVCSHLWHYSL